MLRNVLFALVGISTVALAAGCKTEAVDTDNTTQSTTGSAAGGFGGQSSSGGFGGTSDVGGGGAGGSAECSKEDGALTVDSCNMMTITPSTVPGGTSSATCGENLDENPPGFDLCVRAPEIFTGGSFDYLQGCLSKIGTNPEACEIEPVRACVGEMFAAACVLDLTATNCANVTTLCTAEGDTSFLEAQCLEDMKPFSEEGGWKEMYDCFNASANPGDCQTVWADCYDNQVFTF